MLTFVMELTTKHRNTIAHNPKYNYMEFKNLQTDFKGTTWKHEIDVRDFIQHNYEPYDGDESFLAGPTARTNKLWNILSEMFKAERENGG